jgi:hypothetical protein
MPNEMAAHGFYSFERAAPRPPLRMSARPADGELRRCACRSDLLFGGGGLVSQGCAPVRRVAAPPQGALEPAEVVVGRQVTSGSGNTTFVRRDSDIVAVWPSQAVWLPSFGLGATSSSPSMWGLQGVGMAGAGPDQALMGPGEHLDRLGIGAVAGDAAMVVPVGAHQIGQQFGVGSIRLGTRDVMAVAVAGRRQRIDREYQCGWVRLPGRLGIGVGNAKVTSSASRRQVMFPRCRTLCGSDGGGESASWAA